MMNETGNDRILSQPAARLMMRYCLERSTEQASVCEDYELQHT